jgi:hypothetical protein
MGRSRNSNFVAQQANGQERADHGAEKAEVQGGREIVSRTPVAKVYKEGHEAFPWV